MPGNTEDRCINLSGSGRVIFGSLLCLVILLASTNAVYGQEIAFDEGSSWDDEQNTCQETFSCTRDSTTGWGGNESMRVSTESNDPAVWSWIAGPNLTDSAGKNYSIISHMRLNDWAKQSHVVIEGFNGTSQNWYQIWHCPSGTDGPVEWREFSCEISVPKDTTAMRMILNGGWSTSPNNPATTWFDNISVRSPGSATGANTSSPAPQDVQPQVDRESSAACQSLGFIVCPGEPTTGLFG